MTQAPRFTGCTTMSDGTLGRTTMPKTLVEQGLERKLERALDNMRVTSPPLLFAKRWQLLQARARGGQALVQVCNSDLYAQTTS